ncbi:WAP four-disulfide core domain protein 8, partial [Ophiophagus hannah]
MRISPNDNHCDTFCSSDDSCSDNQLCCATSCGQECKYPEGDTVGYCPVMIHPPNIRASPLCFENCSSDQECNGGFPFPPKKCCHFGGGKLCVEALEVRSDQCQLPGDQGSCSKELQHFYYDPEEKKCVSYVYRGCEDNSNKFETMEECEKAWQMQPPVA